MIYRFKAYGHSNIFATHKTTLEFTKDDEISLKGDCIIGVKADFDLDQIKKFIKYSSNKKIKIIIEAGGEKEEINAELSPSFNSDREMVIRKTDFASERTFGVNSNKAARDLNRNLIKNLRNRPHAPMGIELRAILKI